ncbi:beta-glucosidase [Methylobacterium radiodurans]|uniref:Beta-glucosidase n=1 Tax=Methylobacterium radiodurans TaxID=2202828 RepID=A0A2U8VUL3_9HYPH|nr:beta-glucosidase [Methylobacterium radiodurans]AWN37161.1 beta-glucosidase [Methylobacterium radiodurans]
MSAPVRPPGSPFRSLFLGGFECSTHRRADGRRLDLVAATGHDRHALADYRALTEHGMLAARDGLRWHRIETAPGRYDWSSALPMLEAQRETGLQVIWDLCHYGWPDDLDIWSDGFIERFAAFAAEAARCIRQVSGAPPFLCTVNEISYWAWAGGEVGRIGPLATGAGPALKRQLVRAALAATRAVRAVESAARFLLAEPAIHVVGGPDPESREAAAAYRAVQYEALDMVAGRLAPELGGAAAALDLVGLNFYPDNQWVHGGGTIPLGHHAYRPFRQMLAEAYARYGRPLLVSETGAEGTAKAAWLHYVCGEVRAAQAAGVPVLGICLYPIQDYPGWENERPCAVGLFSAPDAAGVRAIDGPLAAELREQQVRFEAAGWGERA